MTIEHAETVTSIATSVIAVTGVIALVFTMKQLLQARDSDRIKHLLSFVHDFECEPMVSIRRTVAEKRLKGEVFPPEGQKVLDFFETIGLLVRRNYLKVDDVWDCFSYWMFNVYASFRDDIEQEQRDDISYYEDFTDLIEQLRKIEARKGCSEDRPSPEEVEDFWQDEVNVTTGQPMSKRRSRHKESDKGKP
jgi:hypothetical protein